MSTTSGPTPRLQLNDPSTQLAIFGTLAAAANVGLAHAGIHGVHIPTSAQEIGVGIAWFFNAVTVFSKHLLTSATPRLESVGDAVAGGLKHAEQDVSDVVDVLETADSDVAPVVTTLEQDWSQALALVSAPVRSVASAPAPLPVVDPEVLRIATIVAGLLHPAPVAATVEPGAVAPHEVEPAPGSTAWN